jgi:Acyl-CoA oxidase
MDKEGLDSYRLSKAHSRYLVVENFYEALRSPSTTHELDQETLEVMQKLSGFMLYIFMRKRHLV